MTVTITVTSRIATISATERIVAGNTYPIVLALDSEWTGGLFMRVRFGSQYYDIPFASSDTSVSVQFPVGYPEVGIGVFSEALEICTNEARVRLLRSILEQGVSVVEFDSDLYDQWAGEVSELLCDSDFDAESERPLKNSVLTAWKATVPTNDEAVHKTGAETIAGVKTFTSAPIVQMGTPAMSLKSNTQSTGSGRRATLTISDVYGGSETMFGEDRWGNSPAFLVKSIVLNNPDRSAEQNVEIRSFSDHILMRIKPYYPTDSGGNPTPLAAETLITSGNLAVDPRVVHTTGNETIAGDKVFTSSLRVLESRPYLRLRSSDAYSTIAWKNHITFEDVKDGSYSTNTDMFSGNESGYGGFSIRQSTPDRSATYSLTVRAYNDHMLTMESATFYPVDSGGNPQALTTNALVTSGNIAVDPRIVHTTGTETIAGTKDFLTPPTSCHVNVTLEVGQWCRIYSMQSRTAGNRALLRVCNVYRTRSLDDKVAWLTLATSSSGMKKSQDLAFKIGARNGYFDLWVQAVGTRGPIYADCLMKQGNTPIVNIGTPQADPPTVGEEYTAIYDVGEWE